MASKTTAETAPYKTPSNNQHPATEADINRTRKATSNGYKGSDCSYTPSASINPLSYGRDGGKILIDSAPERVVGGHSVSAPLPELPATLKIGENKNVSTPVSGV